MNSTIRILLYCAALFVSAAAFADNVDDMLNMLPQNEKSAASLVLNGILPNQRQGLEDYLEILGTKANGNQNDGIRNYNRALLDKNPCIQNLAAEFYASLNQDEVNGIVSGSLQVGKLGSVSIAQKSTDIGLKPGWLWDKALKYAGGDKLLAMDLIGICGHDDVSQLPGRMKLDAAGSEQFKNPTPEVLQLIRKQILAVMTKSAEAKDLPLVQFQKAADTYLETFKVSNGVSCPNTMSPMFYAQALGADADIPQNLKDRIVRIQAPTKGASVIPAKAYHIMGEAYASCHLVSREVPDFISQKVVMGSINAYRSSRVCEAFNVGAPVDHKKNVSELLSDFKKIRANPAACYTKKEIKEKNVDFYEIDLKSAEGLEYCDVESLLGGISLIEDKDITDEIVIRKLTRKVAEADAQEMFKNSPAYQASNKCSGPQLGTAVRDYLATNGYEEKGHPCPADLAKERCDAARKVMDTYLVDFQWSEAEHLAGLKFAEKNCPSYDTTKSPEQVACRIIGSASKSSNPVKGSR